VERKGRRRGKTNKYHIDEYQDTSPTICVNTNAPPTRLSISYSYIMPAPTNPNSTILTVSTTPTTFMLSHVSGELECISENKTGFWGCPSSGFGVFLLSSLDNANNSSSWLFPGYMFFNISNQLHYKRKRKKIYILILP
jgi:hypothetical protein